MSEHFFLAPSSAGCTVKCAAAPMLQAKHPEDSESPVTREGIAGHWLTAEIVRAYIGVPSPANVMIFAGTPAPNGITFDRELCEAVDECVIDVRDTMQRHPPGAQGIHIEEKLQNDALHPTVNGGTPDLWYVSMHGSKIFIPLWDFKFGHGIVEVFENWQLINYAALILKALNANGLQDQQIMFCFRIIQPRAYHIEGPVRTWTVNAADLRAHFNTLSNAYEAATRPEPPATPGPHCMTNYCTAAGHCAALARSTWALGDMIQEARAHDMKPDALGTTLRKKEGWLKMLQAEVEGLRVQALAMINRGDRVPFYAVAQGMGREVIPDEKVAEFIILGEALGVDVSKPRACITPKQAKAKGLPPDVVDLYAFQRTGERRLVADDGADARRVFGRTTNE